MMSRKPTREELEIVKWLLSLSGADASLEGQLDRIDVEDMTDGGMGGIRFIHGSGEPGKLGRELVVAKGVDLDGTELSIALNLDQFGRLFELDIWKVDFSPLLALPAANTLVMAPY